MTLKEYSEDYAAPETKAAIEKVIAEEIEKVKNPKIYAKAKENLEKIAQGSRDFRF